LTTSNLPVELAATLDYSHTEVQLSLKAALGANSPLNSGVQSDAINNTLNAGIAAPASPGFASLFNLSGKPLEDALHQVSGEAATGAQPAVFLLGNRFLTAIMDRLIDVSFSKPARSALALGFPAGASSADIALAYAGVTKAPSLTRWVDEPKWSTWASVYGGSNSTSGRSRRSGNPRSLGANLGIRWRP
jgi:hypothetical protein